MSMADDVAFYAQDYEDYLESRREMSKEEWQAAIQQKQTAQASDFDDLTDVNTAKTGAFVKWYSCHYRLPRNAWKKGINGQYEHDDVRRGFRAFAAGFDTALRGAKTVDEIREAFEKWHLALMPKRYAYRHEKRDDDSYVYTATEQSYRAFADGYEAGLEFYKENAK